MSDKQPIRKLLESGGKIAGDVAGSSAAGYLWGGLAGAVTETTKTLVKIAVGRTVDHALSDIANRQLSSREETRVGAGAVFAINKIWERLFEGDILRDDEFFSVKSNSDNERSPAEEIFEGSLLKCKNEHQEKKLRYITNIFVNTSFRSDVSPEMANQVLLVAERLSYRQFCIIAVVQRHEEVDFDSRLWNKSSLLQFELGRSGNPQQPEELAVFFRDLYALSPERESLLSYGRESMIVAHGSETGSLTQFGTTCYQLMSLDEIDRVELTGLIRQYRTWI